MLRCHDKVEIDRWRFEAALGEVCRWAGKLLWWVVVVGAVYVAFNGIKLGNQ